MMAQPRVERYTYLYRVLLSAKFSIALVYVVFGPFSGENGAYIQTHEVLNTVNLSVLVGRGILPHNKLYYAPQ